MSELYPVSSGGLWRWVFVLVVLYFGAGYWAKWARTGSWTEERNEFMFAQLFNGFTFAGSVVILWAVMDESVMRLMGDPTPFLMLAGFAGVCFTLRELLRPIFDKRY